jgi:hypothetical protein
VATYVKWEAKIRHIPHAWVPSRPWGPSAEEIAHCLGATQKPHMASTVEPAHEELEDSDSDGDDVLSEGDELLMAIEDMAVAEEYQVDVEELPEDDEWLEDIENGYLPSSPVQIPLKRRKY